MREGGRLYIGKEANRIEERELVTSVGDLTSIYEDGRRHPWRATVLPQLRNLAASPEGRSALRLASGLSNRALRDVLAGRSMPRSGVRVRLVALASKHGITERACLQCGSMVPTMDPRRVYCSARCKKRAEKQRRLG